MLPPTDVDSKVHNTDLFTLQTGENQWHRCTIHGLETNWILLLFPNIHHNTLWKPWLTSDRKTSESWTLVWLTFRVEPLGPMSRCLRFTNRSLLLTIVPILMMSQAMSSCNILTAWRQQHITEVSKSLHHSECLVTAITHILENIKGWNLHVVHAANWHSSVTCSNGTLLASSLIRSLALTMA